jgi:hypothetical protein
MPNPDTAIRSAYTVPSAPSAGPRCNGCGHARRIITDGLLGLVTTTCDECDRRGESRGRQEAYDRGAIARVAVIYGVTVEQLHATFAPPPHGRVGSKGKSVGGRVFCDCGKEIVLSATVKRRRRKCEECRSAA